ncbi:hypothetical protein [Nannocystis sp. SCPEA4]|uniref:DUF6938 domain-containing protein n=1 Tax=Nannocystis sp. SCPEA4 TaxID=2996787 RepID=UPI002271773B|nr:hypothetical protein [Nannocystis sp. SCPEA4]MCY1060661.1 hypothetical protein [Nannocystis sp. SCPEA4]
MTFDPRPAVVAIDMGYGHLRAAHALADSLGVQVLHVDRAPLADAREQERWARSRAFYETISRGSQVPILGRPLRAVLDALTAIPHLYPYRDLSAPDLAIRALRRMIDRGLGAGLVEELRRSGRPLLTTFYAPALIADHAGLERIDCVVTDTDIHRIWAPIAPRRSKIRYLVPSQRAMRRLRVYGVPPAQIVVTGFPLPPALLGGPDLAGLRARLRERLVRLDPTGSFRALYRDELRLFLGSVPEGRSEPPLLTFAVGGAGAQADMVELFLPRMRPAIEAGRLRLALVAGVRKPVAEAFHEQIRRAGLAGHAGVRVLQADSVPAYFTAFNALLAETDILYTKPSELSFFAALGIPLVCARPVGHHERLNRRFLLEAGAGFKQWDPRHTAQWIDEWLLDGTLAAGAWSGFMRLPKTGTYRILELLGYTVDGDGRARSPGA